MLSFSLGCEMVLNVSSWLLLILCGLLDGLIHQLSKKPFTIHLQWNPNGQEQMQESIPFVTDPIIYYGGGTTPLKQKDKYADLI